MVVGSGICEVERRRRMKVCGGLWQGKVHQGACHEDVYVLMTVTHAEFHTQQHEGRWQHEEYIYKYIYHDGHHGGGGYRRRIRRSEA